MSYKIRVSYGDKILKKNTKYKFGFVMQLKSFSTIPQKAITVANVYILICANQLYCVKKRLAQF